MQRRLGLNSQAVGGNVRNLCFYGTMQVVLPDLFRCARNAKKLNQVTSCSIQQSESAYSPGVPDLSCGIGS